MDLNRDGDGFLVNTNDWSEDVMQQMADADGFVITDEIKTYIDKAREMYNATGTVPAVRNFAKEFGMDSISSRFDENSLFFLISLKSSFKPISANGSLYSL